MKLCELSKQERQFSVEFFPPSTDAGFNNLIARAQRLHAMGARFVSVTWGAGGTSAERSVKLAQHLSKALGSKVPIVLHLTCTNMSKKVLDETLAAIAPLDSGIDNILALRGDKPRSDYSTKSDFMWAIDLIRYIKQEYKDRFCIGAAGYPEGFTDSPTHIPDLNNDIEFLADKIEAGAEFVMTQMFYDASKYLGYEKRVREHPRLGPKIADERLFPGIMPLVSYRTFVRSAELSHASIPIAVLQSIKKLDVHDDEKVKEYGVQMMSKLVTELLSSGVHSFHFFSLNLEKCLTAILEKTGLAAKSIEEVNSAPDAPKSPDSRANDWDEFTNGRYTDPSSAAFGEIDGYGPVVHGAIGNQPNPKWGELKRVEDISKLFVRHITNELPVFPFGDQALSAETALIQEELIELNLSGMWTISSQPACNGCPSTDRIAGWGPPNGLIYQESYIEFLLDIDVWTKLLPKVRANEQIAYYAAPELGEVESNCDKLARNVVTWGVWDASRVDTTIIAYESFKVWRDEVFGVIRAWQQLYSQQSDSFDLLDDVANNRVLVAIIYKDSANDRGLWDLLGL